MKWDRVEKIVPKPHKCTHTQSHSSRMHICSAHEVQSMNRIKNMRKIAAAAADVVCIEDAYSMISWLFCKHKSTDGANSKQPNIWFFYLFCNFMLCSSHFCLRHLCKCHFCTLQIVWIVCGRAGGCADARARLGCSYFISCTIQSRTMSSFRVQFWAVLAGVAPFRAFPFHTITRMCLPCSASIYRTIFY